MNKGTLLFGFVVGAIVGLYLPQLFGHQGFSALNLVTALIGGILDLMVIAWYVHRFGR